MIHNIWQHLVKNIISAKNQFNDRNQNQSQISYKKKNKFA